MMRGMMRVIVMAGALAVILYAGGQLVTEAAALRKLDDPQAGFANANGFEAAFRTEALHKALATGDPKFLDQTITDQRSHAPFDPFLMAVSALSGMVRNDRDLQRRAALFDRALLLAPHDRRIRKMRDAGQLMLQTRPPEWQQPAKSGPEVR